MAVKYTEVVNERDTYNILNRMIGSGAKQLYAEVKRQGFPKDKYQLLCSNCNQGKKRGGGICPHKLRNAR